MRVRSKGHDPRQHCEHFELVKKCQHRVGWHTLPPPPPAAAARSDGMQRWPRLKGAPNPVMREMVNVLHHNCHTDYTEISAVKPVSPLL